MINVELVGKLWKKIDEIVDWVKITGKTILGNAMELADNWGGPAGLNYLNEKYGDKIPAELIEPIEKGIEAFVVDDWNGVLAALPESIDHSIDIKQLPDDIEAAWIAANFNALVAFIKYYAKKKSLEG